MKIIFENENFIVVDKPANWLSVPSRWGTKDPRPVVGIELQKKYGSVLPVHRLDEEVSGLLMFAKNANAHRASQDWFSDRTVKKKYVAQSAQDWDRDFPDQFRPRVNTQLTQWKAGDRFRWRCQILRGKKRSYESPKGDWAETEAHLLKFEDGIYHWELWPLTGRSHQLRYELFRHDLPILGDKLYGSGVSYPEDQGIALRAVELSFSDEIGNEVEKYKLPMLIKCNE